MLRTLIHASALLAILASEALGATALPEAFSKALEEFRADGPRGWSFTQTSVSGGNSQVERFDAGQPEYNRWSLAERNGRAPSTAEVREYMQGKAQRSGGLQAPRIQDQIDLATAVSLPPADGLDRWRFRLKPGAADDRAAAAMAVTISFHPPTHTIARFEIASVAPFSPVFGVQMAETRTVMDYSLPADGRPSFLKQVTLRVRGRAFWVKSLDEDMVINYSGHTPAIRPQ